MAKVTADMSISLDGFITGPDNGVEKPLGEAAAGDKDVSIAGGANNIQQRLIAGLLDEIQLHVAPVLLGGGRRLFENMGAERIELEASRVIDSPGVTHLKFHVVK
jgi:dihydrofolate reductase